MGWAGVGDGNQQTHSQMRCANTRGQSDAQTDAHTNEVPPSSNA